MKPHSLLATAECLLIASGKKPSQSSLKRAHSTVYYALFHCLARDAADTLIGSRGSARSKKAWVQVYRALQHNKAWDRCKDVKDLDFPDSVKDFALAFRQMQHKREQADYDPNSRLTKQQVEIDIDFVKQVIDDYKEEDLKHRRAFSAYILLEKRKDKAP